MLLKYVATDDDFNMSNGSTDAKVRSLTPFHDWGWGVKYQKLILEMNSSPSADLQECDKEEPHMHKHPPELAGRWRR